MPKSPAAVAHGATDPAARRACTDAAPHRHHHGREATDPAHIGKVKNWPHVKFNFPQSSIDPLTGYHDFESYFGWDFPCSGHGNENAGTISNWPFLNYPSAWIVDYCIRWKYGFPFYFSAKSMLPNPVGTIVFDVRTGNNNVAT